MPLLVILLIMFLLTSVWTYLVSKITGVSNSWVSIAIPLLVEFETYAAKAYRDYKQWSIGYGSYNGPLTGQPILSYISEADARKRLNVEAPAYYQKYVGQYLTVSINARQKAALTSFAYNYPAGATKVTGMINRKESKDVVKKYWLSITHAGGVELPTLVSRRKREWALFNS